MDKRNRPALGFLLVGVGAAGRALMGVPGGTTIAELTLSALMVIGYLVLVRQAPLPVLFGVAGLVLELILCGSSIDPTALSTIFLRLADLWLLFDGITLTLRQARKLCPQLYAPRTAAVPVVTGGLLALHSAAQLCTVALPGNTTLAFVSMALFVAFSILLIFYTVLFVRAYNELRVKKEK